jgi:hypothetical protein
MEELKILKLNDEDAVPENYTGCAEYSNGNKHWYKEGKRHREDGPAIEYVDGNKCWYIEGKIHREDGPAIEYVDGNKCWYIEDEFMKSEHGIYLTPGKTYKLTGEIHGRYFEQSQKPNKIKACLVLENREEKEEKVTYFFSKVLLNNQIVELVFHNKSFEELE